MDTMKFSLYIDAARLYDYAAAAARLNMPTGECTGGAEARRLQRAVRDIRRCHDEIARRYGTLPSPPAGCEWLLDNWYMIRREARGCVHALEGARTLRRASDGAMAGALCRAMVLSGRGEVTRARFSRFMDGFQSVTVLRRAELCLIPAFLTAAVIEGVAAVCRELRRAADTEEYARTLEALFTSLRLFSTTDMERLADGADVTNAICNAESAGIYPRMDSGTKKAYLRRIETLARRAGTEEHVYARALTKKAAREGRHIGFLLFPEKKGRAAELYIAANVLVSVSLTLFIGFRLESTLAAALLFIPVTELIKSAADYIALHLSAPRRLFRMDTQSGVPPEGRTICVISTLLGAEADVRALEELYHACRSEGEALYFGMLADLPEADSAAAPGDEALLARAVEGVRALNLKYGARFYLFTRQRQFDGTRYSARERKRGALLELARLLCDEDSELEVFGEKDALAGIRYILTLDSDTRVYPGAAGQLIGAMLHPLNAPVIDARTNVVTAGHAVIHPRMDAELESACATDFALIFAGAGGSDPYGGLCGELYMDAFDCGGFSGKGLIDARALLQCTRAFPAGRVLSHDAPEGAYLRGGFMGDAEFSDRFPARPLAYYKRAHRWIRGDWQNIPFIPAPGLRDIDRWRLIDSLRRSLIAPATLLAILAGFFMPGAGLRVAAWAALMALMARLIIALAEGGLSARPHRRARRFARALSGAGGAIVQGMIRLWLLPYEAWISITAIFTALWRLCVTKKRLLEWQTAAADPGGISLAAHFKAMHFPVIIAAALILFCPTVIGKSAGLMWLVSPAAAYALALPARRATALAANERAYLIDAAGQSFNYFKDFFSAEDSFLPPDNFQEQPPVGLARRTSPTNIGLALAAHTAAVDMGLETREACVEHTLRMLDTLERMPKLMGHFYNWYDTATLTPLHPAYISTVDSGNLYAGLVTARQAMREFGQAEAAARIEALIAPMSFKPLYDSERGLFHICYDAEKGRGAGGWYDLMASEAMLTSYIAAARGDVPARHWRRLSRAQLQKDGYRGLASWTGTMFEYLMPELFLPLYHGSLLYESGRFCLYAQKRRVWVGKPWGVSESAFYSLDAALNYRYKAHGCPALALRRGMEQDMVISPYSSFLALAIDPEGGIRNLRLLESFGAKGRYGFIEALDFTPARCRSDSGEQVRCYMAHHIGMSVIAAANAACGGSVQRRFMSAPEMGAFSLLLQERVDDGGVIMRADAPDVPERFERGAGTRWQLRGGAEDTERRCCALSNGAYNLRVTNALESRADCAGVTIYDCAPGMGAPGGLCAAIEADGRETPLIPCPQARLWQLEEDAARVAGTAEGIDYECAVSAAYGDCGELRTVTLCAARDISGALIISLRPILAPQRAYEDHPAYWALGLVAEEEGGALRIRRMARRDCGALCMTLCANRPAHFSADRGGGLGGLAQPLARIAIPIELKAGQRETVRLALAVAPTGRESDEGAQRILVAGINDRGNMVSAAAAHLKMSGEKVGEAMALLGAIWPDRTHSGAPRAALWPHGISGELPLICCDGRAVEAEGMLRRFCLLKSCGVEAELAYLTEEQGEYAQPVFRRVSDALAQIGLEAIIGTRGGVFFTPMDDAAAIISRAAYTVGAARKPLPAPPRAIAGIARRHGCVPRHGFCGGEFVFTVKNDLPGRVWQNVLSNSRMGYIAADCGAGYMWLENARELRISPPTPDINAVEGAESLWCELPGGRVSLFAANDGYECRVSFAPGYARWEKLIGGRRIITTAFIAPDVDARIFLIEGAEGLRIGWSMRCTALGPDEKGVTTRVENGALFAANADAPLAGAEVCAACTAPGELYCGYTPCSLHIALTAGAESVIACGVCPAEALISLCAPHAAYAALEDARRRALSDAPRVETGDAAFDEYMNTWCVYQCRVCRLEARASLYQSGGAIGFRDQLQDAVNLILISPAPARARIIDCCRHQYREGDVMHWWHRHAERDRGVRTRCSDDLLWLVWALAEYTEKTGDLAICREACEFITSAPLAAHERDRYEAPEHTIERESVYEHARRALERCISRGFGAHGLPRIGSGDWNDALDAVDGESVWLGWFFADCAARFAALTRRMEMGDGARYDRLAARVAAAAEAAWTGRWYARAYYADGAPLAAGDRIDSVAQSWAVICRAAPESNRPGVAVDSALRRLIDRDHGLVRLLAPPYGEGERSPGYITSYGEGFRENGGQYTHGALWLAMACLRLGRAEEAWEILRMLLAENHDAARYGAEPFILAADVYSAPGHEGEAGWSWYTGSAGWYFRVVYEELLGLRLRDGHLTISPRLPATLREVGVRWRDKQGRVRDIRISHGAITVDGRAYSGEALE